MLVLDTTATVSTECGPVVVHPPTSIMPNSADTRKRKRRPYVLVPPAPYRLPSQGSDSQRRTQAVSSTSALSSTQHGPQHMVNRPEQRVPSLQEKLNVPKALTTFKPSNQTLSDIGISIPTTVRKSGSFIIHTHEIIPRDEVPAQMPPTERPLQSFTARISKPPHVANPVTAQVITKKRPMSGFKINKTKPTTSKPPPSSSNDTTVFSTSTQEVGRKPSLLESQPAPPPISPSEIANVFPVEFAASFAEAVVSQVGFMLCQKVSRYFDIYF